MADERRTQLIEKQVPHLDRAGELLWQAGHSRIAEALTGEVEFLADYCAKLEAAVRAVPGHAVIPEVRALFDTGPPAPTDQEDADG
jgi:hypothetical protein